MTEDNIVFEPNPKRSRLINRYSMPMICSPDAVALMVLLVLFESPKFPPTGPIGTGIHPDVAASAASTGSVSDVVVLLHEPELVEKAESRQISSPTMRWALPPARSGGASGGG